MYVCTCTCIYLRSSLRIEVCICMCILCICIYLWEHGLHAGVQVYTHSITHTHIHICHNTHSHTHTWCADIFSGSSYSALSQCQPAPVQLVASIVAGRYLFILSIYTYMCVSETQIQNLNVRDSDSELNVRDSDSEPQCPRLRFGTSMSETQIENMHGFWPIF